MNAHNHSQTRISSWSALIALVLLNSCGFAYKPTVSGTNKSNDIYTIPLGSSQLNMTAGVDVRGKDTAAFDVFLWTDLRATEPAFKINSLKLSLTDYHQKDYVLREVSLRKEDKWGKLIPIYNGTAITDQALDRDDYNLTYRFIGLSKKALHHRLHIDIACSITEAGKTTEIHRSVDFKRYFWLDIAGN